MSFRSQAPGPRLENQIAVACVLAGLALVVILIVRILLPWLLGAGLVGAGIWFWHRHQTQRRALHLLFYEHLETHQGRISVLEFAMATGLTGPEARAFLDDRAREFFANFEPIDSGDVLYTFHAPDRATVTHSCDQPVTTDGRPSPSSTTHRWLEPDSPLRLTEAELAQRLDCSASELVTHRQRADLVEWSRRRDPDSCGWAYNAGCDRYFPVCKD
jgi:hypothetical protein